ncbi:MAG: tRNA (adenosine(37)-N6)-threonylcarbamoyltransferase complex transferase subunit TsaD [Burkholderiales bacterium]
MLVLGIETSCDESGVALYHTQRGLLGHRLHSQSALHEPYGGVVPELASRDHIRRVLPLVRNLLQATGVELAQLNGIAYTRGPGLAGALLVGASIANALAHALNIPAVGVHHMEGHLLVPLLEPDPPPFPFVALLVSGGHTQLIEVERVGRYTLLGETVDDAAGEAFDKTAKLLGLGYPGGAEISKLALQGQPGRFKLPRPMLKSRDLNFSFSGLKTAVAQLVRTQPLDDALRADIARSFQDAMVDVLAAKAWQALKQTGLNTLVVAGGVGANRQLREGLAILGARAGFRVFYPRVEFCTDNGAMIAYAGALRLRDPRPPGLGFSITPRWELADIMS